MNVYKNIQTAVAQAQATYTPSVMNTNNYGQMYGVDAMAGYKWFFGKTKRFGFRTYGYYSYNHANLSFVGSKLGIMEGASQVNNSLMAWALMRSITSMKVKRAITQQGCS
ncbi:hypothetical protein HpHNI24_00250 [Helicobacter pylori]